MKIILSRYINPHFETCAEFCENALIELGHECLTFDDRAYMFPGRLRKRLPCLQKMDSALLNKRLVKICKDEKPELLFVIGGNRILKPAIEKLKSLNIITVLWTTDPPNDFANIMHCANSYDYVFCAGGAAIELLKGTCVELNFLPFAYDSTQHGFINVSEKDKKQYGSDVVFVGSHYPNREKDFNALAALDFSIWGPGWDKVKEQSNLYTKVKNVSGVDPEQWMKIYSSSKIAVVAHYHDGKTPCTQLSPKIYEAMACGVMVVSDRQADGDRVFKENKEIVYYDNPKDLENKVNYYLKNENQRKEIAQAGMKKVKAFCSYTHRMKEMLEKVSGE